MKCPKCGYDNREGAKFCRECGTALEQICPQCQHHNEPDAKFCDECGTKLAEVFPIAPPRLEDMQKQLQHRIPQSLADRLFAGAKQMQGEYRLVTALFADVSGSSDMARDMALEQYVETMNDCFKMMVDTISIKYEGSINRFIGDCVLAFFGAPITHENDAERAILAALDIREGVKELGLDVSVGINTGMTYVGEMGSDLTYSERSAWGPDVDFARRLQEAAEPGEVYVGSHTYRLVRRAFDFCNSLGIQVKGMEELQPAYPVIRVKEHPEKLRGIEDLEARMIGREREFTALIDSANSLMNERRGQIVTIVGEAGIGKSRMVRELKEYVEDQDILWLEGRCLSIGQSVSFWPFIDIMRTHLCISSEETEEEVARKLVQEFSSLFAQEADAIISYVGHMLSIKLEERYQGLIRYASPEQIRRQTLLRMRDAFVALARRKSMILVLEDLHWADDLSLDLLWTLMDELVAAPMILVCIHRPEKEHGSWQIDSVASSKHIDRYTRLLLKPLTDKQTQQMIESLLDIEDLPQEVRDAILDRTEGNPFFVEEIIRLLIEQEVIYFQDSRWKARDSINTLAVPDTVQSVVLSRVDRLQEEVRYVLQCASVIGRVFQRRLLNYLMGQEKSIESHLSQLESSDLVYKERIVPELEYAFKHALTQETTYQRMLVQQRSQFHKRVGEGIEALYKEQLEENYERLAYHYSRSDNREKAVEYLIKAGQKSAARYANQESLDYYQQALELTNSDEDRNRILEQRGKLLLGLFRGREAADDYEKLLERIRNSGDTKRELAVMLGLGWAYYIIALDNADFITKYKEMYESAYSLARKLGDKEGMIRALIPTVWYEDFWPDLHGQAMANLEEALSLSQEIGNKELIMDSRIAMLKYQSPREEKEHIGELLEYLKDRNDLIRLKELYFRLMNDYRYSGDFEKAIECCDAGIHLAHELGVLPFQYPSRKAGALMDMGRYGETWNSIQDEVTDEGHPVGAAFRDNIMGIYFLELMSFDKANEMFEKAIDQAKRIGRTWLVFNACQGLFISLIRSGERHSKDPDEIFQAIESRGIGIESEVLAEIALYAGRLDEALQETQEMCLRAKDGEYKRYFVVYLELQARILLKMQRYKEALGIADEGIQMAEEMKYAPMLWRLRAAKAQALEKLGDSRGTAREYKAATGIIHRLAENIPQAELRQAFIHDPQVSSIVNAWECYSEKEGD